MPVEEDAELVDPVGDLVLIENMDVLWRRAGASEDLVQRKHRVIAGVIGVVAGRPVDGLAPSLGG